MNHFPIFLRDFLLRLLLCLVLVVAFRFVFGPLFLLSIPFLIAGVAILMAKPFADLFGVGAGSLFYPNSHYDRPQPIYGIPTARRKEGHFEEALLGFHQITAEHPQEVPAWIQLVDIAANDLNDLPRAKAYFHSGLNHLNAEADRNRLTNACAPWIKRQDKAELTPPETTGPRPKPITIKPER